MPMLSMQLRSLRVRVRALAGSFSVFFDNVEDTLQPVGYNFYFVCITGTKNRRALPAIEEKIGDVFYTVI